MQSYFPKVSLDVLPDTRVILNGLDHMIERSSSCMEDVVKMFSAVLRCLAVSVVLSAGIYLPRGASAAFLIGSVAFTVTTVRVRGPRVEIVSVPGKEIADVHSTYGSKFERRTSLSARYVSIAVT